MRSILTLDLATRIGWCVGSPDQQNPKFGIKQLPSTGNDVGSFLLAFNQWLSDIIALENPALVVFEAPILPRFGSNHNTSRKLMCLAGHTEYFCKSKQILCSEANVMSVKKFFAGHGRADKAMMIARANQLGWQVKDDNEADACALWAFTVQMKAPQFAERFRMGALI